MQALSSVGNSLVLRAWYLYLHMKLDKTLSTFALSEKMASHGPCT